MVRLFRFMVLQSSRKERAALCRVPVTGRTPVSYTHLFAAALLFGLPLFFLLKDSTGTSLASMAMIAVMLPCFLFAMYEKHGQPLEVVVKNIIQTKFIAPKERPYRTDNLYSVLELSLIHI